MEFRILLPKIQNVHVGRRPTAVYRRDSFGTIHVQDQKNHTSLTSEEEALSLGFILSSIFNNSIK